MSRWKRIGNRFFASHKLLLLIVVIHLLFLFPFMKPGIFDTHDGQLHIARIAAYDKAIGDGQFPVRWARDLNYTYGSPLFIFYYPLPYMFGTILHRIGFTFIDSFKILLSLAFLLSPVSFYLWMKQLVAPKIAVASALIYGLAPYHFMDLFVRGAIGELFAFVCIPIILLGIEEIYNKRFKMGFLLTAIFYAMLILSHNTFALLFTGVCILYTLFRLTEPKQWLMLFSAILLGLGLSAYFWLPSMLEQRYTHVELFDSAKYIDNFPMASQLIWSPWGLGKEVTKAGGLSPQIGPIQLLVVILSLVLLKWSKKNHWIFWFGLILFIAGIFFSIHPSITVWNHITFLKRFEFPWRFTGLISFAAAVMSAFLFTNKSNNIFLITISSGLILLSLSLTKTGQQLSYSDLFYSSYGHSTDFGGTSTIWTAGDPFAYPKTPLETASGDTLVTSYQRLGTTHTFDLSSRVPSVIVDNTLYYPGWHVRLNNKEVPIEFQDANHRGLITFHVPAGESNVKVFFEETAFRKLTDIISILFFAVLLIMLVYSFRSGALWGKKH